MSFLLIILGIILSIVKANEWIIVPTFCTILCWVMSFLYLIIYSCIKGIVDILVKESKK